MIEVILYNIGADLVWMDALEKFDKNKKGAIEGYAYKIRIKGNHYWSEVRKQQPWSREQLTRLTMYYVRKKKTWKIHDAEHRQN